MKETRISFSKIIRYIIDIAVPALSAYLANNDSLVQFLINKKILSNQFNVGQFQNICLIVNILFTTFVLYMKILLNEAKEESSKRKISGLYKMVKTFIQSNLGQISGDKNISFDLRIFVPKRSILAFLRKIFHKRNEKWFYIRNIEPFASRDTTEHLKFRVDPDPQGLVGQAYSTKSIVYDDNLSVTNSIAYSLDQTQVSRTSNLLWSICVPVLDEKNEVIAIVALDSNTTKLNIKDNKDEIRNITNTLAVMMNDSVPEFFKKKGLF